MHARDCIDTALPFLRPTDDAGYALDLMQEYKATHLAIVDQSLLVGVVSEQQLLDSDDQLSLSALQEHLLPIQLQEEVHLFDVHKTCLQHNIAYLPVVRQDNEYIGITSPHKILEMLGQYSSVNSSGSIIVIETEARNYSLTEISKIVESNGGSIIHAAITSSTQGQLLQVSLKINKNDLKDIQLTFERYQYQVVAVFHQSEYELQLKERYDSLMRYLEV